MEDPDDPARQDEVAQRLMALAAKRRADQDASESSASEADPESEETAD